jgi:hypothetical protein
MSYQGSKVKFIVYLFLLLSIGGIVSKLNIPLIDLHEDLFSKKNDPSVLFEGGINNHYNSSAYKQIAKEITRVIHKNK